MAHSYWRRVIIAFVLGLPGVMVLAFVLDLPPGVPQDIPRALLTVNPAVLLLAAALVGGWAAPKLNLKSRVIAADPLSEMGLGRWMGIGIVAGLGVAVADWFLVQATAGPEGISITTGWDLGALVLGLSYGGFTEEVIMRWGLMSLLAIGLVRLTGGRTGLWVAALVAALLFALGHLPLAAMETGGINGVTLIRVLGWNTLLGLVFATGFIRSCLEAAIAAHVGCHLGFALVALGFGLV